MDEGNRVHSFAKSPVRRRAAAWAAAIALSGGIGVGSALADVTYTSYTWTGDDVDITSVVPNVDGGAGQIQLKTSTGTILAWCLDIYDYLTNSGAYSVTPNGSINNNGPNLHIGGLIAEGNSLIQTNAHLKVDGITFDVQDESAATQIAIWTAEYGTGFKYTITTSTPGATAADFADLVTTINNAAGTSNYFTLTPDCTADPKDCPNQTLGFVPGPIVGTGLPGLLAACAGLIGLARRRRRVVA